jgi:hypothetical protein
MAEALSFVKHPDLPILFCVLDNNGRYSVGTYYGAAASFDDDLARQTAELYARRAKARHEEARAERQARRRAAEAAGWGDLDAGTGG